MYVKPNNAGKGMWPRAQTANQKFKQFGKTQDVEGMPALSVLYISTMLNSMYTNIPGASWTERLNHVIS